MSPAQSPTGTRTASRVKLEFLRLRRLALDRCDYLPHIKIEACFQAEKQHDRDASFFAHQGHRKHTICVASAIESLTDAEITRVLTRQFGRILDYHFEPETDADEVALAKIDTMKDPDARADAVAAWLLPAGSPPKAA